METITQRLQEEIAKPIYKGKTATEIADMINNSTTEDVEVTERRVSRVNGVEQYDENGELIMVDHVVTKQVVHDAVAFSILNGIAGAPNLITEEDVINAQ